MSKLNYKKALIDEINRIKPNLYSLNELEKMSEDSLKDVLDKLCEGRL